LTSASPGTTTVFRVQHVGKWLVAVYRKDTKTIRTFLPPHAKVQHRRLKGRGVLPIQVMRRGDR
jgi:ribosomal protein S18